MTAVSTCVKRTFHKSSRNERVLDLAMKMSKQRAFESSLYRWRPVAGAGEGSGRIAVTQDFLAVSVAKDMAGKPVNHPAKAYFPNALYESIHGLVFKLAQQYTVTCHEEVEDLAQICWARIIKKLMSFDPRKGKFITWAGRICLNELNRRYRMNARRREKIVSAGERIEENPDLREATPDRGSMIEAEIKDTIRELASMHPDKKRLVFAMFGNPNRKKFVLPSKAMVAEAAQKTGMHYSMAHAFYRDVVREFFKARFDCGGRTSSWAR